MCHSLKHSNTLSLLFLAGGFFLVFFFSCQLWTGRKDGGATLNLAPVMCLSLWACYIQIKGGFTDRRQAPAPTSNQTVPSGEPCGAHICGHSFTAWHGDVLQESSTWIMRSWEQECSAVSERWVMCVKIRDCIYEHWQNVSGFMFCSLFSFRTSGWVLGGRVPLPPFLKALRLQGSP